MISMYDYKMVDPDFNLEKTFNENNLLKKNNRALGIIWTVIVVTLLVILTANRVIKSLEVKTKQLV
jgi:hypothetical protein